MASTVIIAGKEYTFAPHVGHGEWITMEKEKTKPVEDEPVPLQGVWIAYYSDWSGIAVFETELHALRYANQRAMEVKFLPFERSFGPGDMEE